MRLVCWNADGLRGSYLELEHFFSQDGVDIFLLSETFLNPGQAFRLAYFVCHLHRETDNYGAAQPSWSAVVQSTHCTFRDRPTWSLLPSKSHWPANHC